MKECCDFTLKQYKQGTTADFYIQCKGLHSGKPLRSPIPNCFSVHSKNEHFFEIVFALYKGKQFEPHIHGTAIPFITISDAKNVLIKGLEAFDFSNLQKLKGIGLIDTHISNLLKQIELYKQVQYSICRSLLA